MQGNGGQVVTHRVITMLGRQEMDYLDKLGKDALFSTGHKLSYNDILRALIDFAMEAGISGEKIDSAQSFKDNLSRQLSKLEIKKGGN